MLFDVKSSAQTLKGLSAKEVVYHIEQGQIPLDCQIFHPMKQRWEALPENRQVAETLASKLGQAPVSFNYDSLFYHWSLKNYITHQGFFTLMEVVEKLQSNKVNKATLIKHPKVPNWTEIAQLPIFSEESIRTLYQLHNLEGFFADRTQPRPEADT